MNVSATRLNAFLNSPIDLEYRHYVNNQLATPFDLPKVEIYKENTENAGITLIETLFTSTGDIVEVSTGIFQYAMGAVTSTGRYFDRVFIQSTSTGGIVTDETAFDVRETDLSIDAVGTATLATTCRVFGQITDAATRPLGGSRVAANIARFPVLLNSFQLSLSQDPEIVFSNALGVFAMDLPRNAEIYITIPDINFSQYIKVPDADSANLFTISAIKEIGDATGNDTLLSEADW